MNSNTMGTTQVEEANAAEEIVFIDTAIRANLPAYRKADTVPNKDYNKINKLDFSVIIKNIYEDIR